MNLIFVGRPHFSDQSFHILSHPVRIEDGSRGKYDINKKARTALLKIK